MPHLVYQPPGGESPTRFELHKRLTSIGSSDENDICVSDDAMADTHAIIQFDGRTFALKAMGSDPPIVNGRPRTKHDLVQGDEILIGGTVFTFALYGGAEAIASQATDERVQSYRSVLEFCRNLLANPDLGSLLEDVMDAILELTRADKGFLILVEDEELHVKVARNVANQGLEAALGQFSDSIVGTVIRTRKPLVVADALNHSQFSNAHSVVNLKVCSVMCAPLLDRDQLLGLIYVGNDNVVNLFTEQHVDVLTIFAAQASLILARAIAMDELRSDNIKLREQIDDMRFGSMIGACDAIKQVYKRVEKVAATDVSVLITGETGTGKELIAKEIHARSDRKSGPFVTINCGAIPENLLESELFGHVRGAFTGATANRPGKFQAAGGGTLFLDEIGEMPINLQVKILRALQERAITRVGETRPERVDIRVIAATHRDLVTMIGEGAFREDLYYRLNVVTLDLPPLRDRGDDIVLIARYFLDKYVREFNVGRKSFTRESVVGMKKFAWPGNIRQLENHIKKAVILSESSSIRPEDLDLSDDGMKSILPLAEARDLWQRDYILEILELNAGNRTKTARDLGVDPRTVFRFLEKEGERGDDDA